jgi:hypothetical protein
MWVVSGVSRVLVLPVVVVVVLSRGRGETGSQPGVERPGRLRAALNL